MRRAAKTDRNHGEVVDALRRAGCCVLDLSAVGQGCPDIMAWHPVTGYHLIEIKDGKRIPSQRRLNARQVKFHDEWKGPIHTVNNPFEALVAVGEL